MAATPFRTKNHLGRCDLLSCIDALVYEFECEITGFNDFKSFGQISHDFQVFVTISMIFNCKTALAAESDEIEQQNV